MEIAMWIAMWIHRSLIHVLFIRSIRENFVNQSLYFVMLILRTYFRVYVLKLLIRLFTDCCAWYILRLKRLHSVARRERNSTSSILFADDCKASQGHRFGDSNSFMYRNFIQILSTRVRYKRHTALWPSGKARVRSVVYCKDLRVNGRGLGVGRRRNS